eukprot:g52247.t1
MRNTASARLDKNARDMSLNMIAGGCTTALCVALLNPLDVMRVRWQTLPPPQISAGSLQRPTSLLQLASETLSREGLWRIYRCGLGVTVASVTVSSGLRLGLYPSVRDSLVVLRGGASTKRPLEMWFAGFLSGALGFFLATPFFAAKIRSQATDAVGSGGHHLLTLLRGGPRKAYSGASVLVMRGACLSSGASLGYDATKTYALRFKLCEDGPALQAVSSVMQSFLASLFAAPADVIMTRHVTAHKEGKKQGYLQTVQLVYREGGIKGLFKGWPLFFARLIPLWLVQMPMYEQLAQMALRNLRNHQESSGIARSESDSTSDSSDDELGSVYTQSTSNAGGGQVLASQALQLDHVLLNSVFDKKCKFCVT